MDRRSIIRNAGLAGVLATGIAPAVVHAQANIRWRLTSGFPKALDTIYGAAENLRQESQGHERRQVRDFGPCGR